MREGRRGRLLKVWSTNSAGSNRKGGTERGRWKTRKDVNHFERETHGKHVQHKDETNARVAKKEPLILRGRRKNDATS